MTRIAKYFCAVLIMSGAIALTACARPPGRNELPSLNKPTWTMNVRPSQAPPQKKITPTARPTMTPISPTSTSGVDQSQPDLTHRSEIFGHDYAEEGQAVYSAFVTRDGRHLLVTLEDYYAEIIELESKRRTQARLGCELFWPDVVAIDIQESAWMLCSDYSDGVEFQVWKLDAGSEQAKMISAVRHDPLLTATALAFSPDGQYFALGFHNGEVHIYKSSSGNLLRQIHAHIDNVTSMAFSPDSRYLLTDSWSFDFETYVYDVQSGQKIATLISEGVGSPNTQSVWFSPDGSLAAGMSTTGLEVFSTSSWTQLYSLPSRYWGWLGCDNKTWFDAANASQVDIYALNSGELLMTVPTYQLFCLADQQAAYVEFDADKITLYALSLY